MCRDHCDTAVHETVRPHWAIVLRAIREACSVTQDGWAARLGVSRRTVQRWERGELAPDTVVEAAITAYCAEKGLFRLFEHGALRGVALSRELLRNLLVEARLGTTTAWGRPADTESVPGPPGAVKAAVAPGAAGQPPFAGRQQELATLTERLTAACRRQGSVVLVAGEPGIGKTRLAEELAAIAPRHGAQVLWGRCYEGEGAPAFWPWVQVLRAYVRTRDPQPLLTQLGPGAADIVQLVPTMREWLPRLPPPPPLEPEQARFRLFDSVTTFLTGAAGSQPMVLILDDLHWADTPSLLLLQFLARELRGSRLLVVGTYRDVEVGREHPFAQTLAWLARGQGSERIHLRGLAEADIAQFVAHVAGRQWPATLVTAVYQETEGNPFFATEVVRFMTGEGRLEQWREGSAPQIGIPHTVREVVRLRLHRRSAACKRILTSAAVIGRQFSLAALQRMSEPAGDALLEALEEAEAAGLIMEVPGAHGRYRFAHSLIRETLYEDVPSPRRIRLHQQVGAALERVYETAPEPPLAELAHHFFQAAPGGDVDRAVAYARRAGDRSLALLAYEEGVRLYGLALQAIELQEPVDATQRSELLLALGDAQLRSGALERAKETFQQAAAVARKLGLAPQLARAALGLAARIEVGVVDEPLIRLLEESLAALGEQDSTLRAQALAYLAEALCWAGDAERTEALSGQAVAMAQRLSDPATLAAALSSRHWDLLRPDALPERLAVATEILHLGKAAGDPTATLDGHHLRLIALFEMGDIRAVDHELTLYDRLAAELRQPRFCWRAATLQAMRALWSGRLAEGERLVHQALAIGARVRPGDALGAFVLQLCALRREQGRLAELEGPVRGALERYPTLPIVRAGFADVCLGAGREAEARHTFDELAANDFAGLPWDSNWLPAMAVLAQVCAVLGDADRAAILYRRLGPYAGRCVVAAFGLVGLGSVSYYLGNLAMTLRHWEEAVRHFEDAVAMHARMGTRPWLAHTQHDYAAMLLARGQPGGQAQALDLLAQAHVTAQELGMICLAEQTRTLQAWAEQAA